MLRGRHCKIEMPHGRHGPLLATHFLPLLQLINIPRVVFAEQMPGNTTAGSTLLDEELRRILLEREQECMKLKAMNTTPPPGNVFFMFENKRDRAKQESE